jgi:hypothetical protein
MNINLILLTKELFLNTKIDETRPISPKIILCATFFRLLLKKRKG